VARTVASGVIFVFGCWVGEPETFACVTWPSCDILHGAIAHVMNMRRDTIAALFC